VIFRRQLHRAIVPALFAIGSFVGFALTVTVPGTTGYAIAGAGLSVLLCAALHGGLILTDDGIAWYILRPAWRYRFIPWSAVRDVRKFLFVLHPVRLIMKPGERELCVWPKEYIGGERLWDAIHERWQKPLSPSAISAGRALP
jgi:hypothetical protein